MIIDHEEKEILKKCMVCGSTESEIMYSGMCDVTYQTSIDQWTIHKCKKCCSAFLNPRLNEKSIYKAYENYHTHAESNEVDNKSNNFFKRIRRSIANGYRNWYFKTEIKPSNKIGIVITLLFPGIKEAIEAEGRNLSKINIKSLNVLDVGFGGGGFLRLSKEMGWSTYGVDTDPVTVKNALSDGLEVKLGGIEAFDEHTEFFDVLTISHVIEHVHNPKLFLMKAHKLLKPGGQIWIETPNIESTGHKNFKKNWRGLEVPRHLTIFSWGSLEKLIFEVGFTKVQRRPRRWLYYSMAMASLKIKNGESNKTSLLIKLNHWLKGRWLNTYSKSNYTKTEFITLIAFK